MTSSGVRNTNCSGIIFNIQRFSLHDGTGIRTLVFFKGCPLRCLWCSNPESQQHRPEVAYNAKDCLKCGNCVASCPHGALAFNSAGLLGKKAEACQNCLACVRNCPSQALSVIGAHYSVEETFRIIEKDVIFYRNSGGGVTLGGGDPLLQADFARRLLAKCKETNIRTAMETSAYAPWSALSGVCRLTDEIFVDIKHIDPQRHRELTGFSNEPVLENIAKLAAVHPGVVVRYPLIPGCNDGEEDIKGLAAWVRKNLRNPYVELSPYHCLGTHKYRQLWRDYALAETREPSAEQVGNTVGLLGTLGVDSKSLH